LEGGSFLVDAHSAVASDVGRKMAASLHFTLSLATLPPRQVEISTCLKLREP